ncbi:MAG: hypothetical protein LBE16_09430, partial [Clostridiales Family XIII bacterium]|nr:hypothetical protein [Clostridiales Family XIII bacterium]
MFFEPGGKTAGDDGFAFEYDQDTRTITITGPKLGIGEIKTIEYTTRVSYGAAVAGSIENTAYLVPDGTYYFERGDTEKGFTANGNTFSLEGKLSSVEFAGLRAAEAKAAVGFSANIGVSARKFLDIGRDGTAEAYSGDPKVSAERGRVFAYGFELKNSGR